VPGHVRLKQLLDGEVCEEQPVSEVTGGHQLFRDGEVLLRAAAPVFDVLFDVDHDRPRRER
jgi:hypothetical protein